MKELWFSSVASLPAICPLPWRQYVRLPKVLFAMFSSTPVLVRQVATELHHQVTYLTRLDIQPQGKLSSFETHFRINECTECWPVLSIYCNILSNMYNDVQCIWDQMTEKCNCLAHQLQNSYIKSCLGSGSHDHRICRARWAQWYGLPKARQ